MVVHPHEFCGDDRREAFVTGDQHGVLVVVAARIFRKIRRTDHHFRIFTPRIDDDGFGMDLVGAESLGIPPGTYLISSVEVIKILRNKFEDLEVESLRLEANKAFRLFLLSWLIPFLLFAFMAI